MATSTLISVKRSKLTVVSLLSLCLFASRFLLDPSFSRPVNNELLCDHQQSTPATSPITWHTLAFLASLCDQLTIDQLHQLHQLYHSLICLRFGAPFALFSSSPALPSPSVPMHLLEWQSCREKRRATKARKRSHVNCKCTSFAKTDRHKERF